MKELIRKTTEKYGYTHVVVTENGTEIEQKWLKRTPDNYLFFEHTNCARKCVSVDLLDSKLKNIGDEIEVTAENLSKRGQNVPVKQTVNPVKLIEDYLEGEDKEAFLKLLEKAKRNKAIAEKKAEIEKLTKELEGLSE